MHSVAHGPTPQLSRALAACRPELLRGARQLVGRNDAEDLLQSTFERALRHLGSFQPETNMLAWLRRIMSNLSVDSWRRQNRHPVGNLDLGRECPAPTPEPSEPWEELTAAEVRAAAQGLPARFREVFELHYDRGLPYAEISRRLRVPLGTVGTRLLRARNQLRKVLTQTLANRQASAALPSRRPPIQLVFVARQLVPVLCANDQIGKGPRPPAARASGRRAARPAAAAVAGFGGAALQATGR